MKDIILPQPELNREFPLMKSLQLRRTKRKWKNELLSLQEISNILWSGCGETLKTTKRSKNRRTVPSACNSQLVDVYACLERGVYKYLSSEHKLEFVSDVDVRSILGTQKMMKSAPFGLIYVCDFSKRTGIIKSDESKKMFLAGTETGFISQNVYLYCASSNLSTVLIAMVDRDRLAEVLGLNELKVITYTQIIGEEL